MENSDPTTPMLRKDGRGASRSSRRGRLSRRYSVNSLRTEFVSRLPDTVRSALDLESSTYDLDLSRARALSKGISLSVRFFDKIICRKIKARWYVHTQHWSFDFFLRWSASLVLCVGQRAYYERQFDTLKSFEEVDTVMASDCVDEENPEEQSQHESAMRISNYANVALLAFKVVY